MELFLFVLPQQVYCEGVLTRTIGFLARMILHLSPSYLPLHRLVSSICIRFAPTVCQYTHDAVNDLVFMILHTLWSVLLGRSDPHDTTLATHLLPLVSHVVWLASHATLWMVTSALFENLCSQFCTFVAQLGLLCPPSSNLCILNSLHLFPTSVLSLLPFFTFVSQTPVGMSALFESLCPQLFAICLPAGVVMPVFYESLHAQFSIFVFQLYAPMLAILYICLPNSGSDFRPFRTLVFATIRIFLPAWVVMSALFGFLFSYALSSLYSTLKLG